MIACIGEKLDEREGGITEKVVFAQTKVIAGMQLPGQSLNGATRVQIEREGLEICLLAQH